MSDETQFDKQKDSKQANRNLRIWQAVKSNFPDICQQIPKDNALDITNTAIEDAEQINITEDEDLIYFVGLAFLPEEIRNDPWVSSMLIRFLNRVDTPAPVRLEFIYKHVLPHAYNQNS